MRYKPQRERASEFWDKFEEKVRVYENTSDANKLSEQEKRDIFFQAIVEGVPEVNVEASRSRTTVSGEVHFSRYKRKNNYKNQNHSKIGSKPFHMQTQREQRRCFECGRGGHLSMDCPTPGKKYCYKCSKTVHVSHECRSKKLQTSPQGAPKPAKMGRRTPPKSEARTSPKGGNNRNPRPGPSGMYPRNAEAQNALVNPSIHTNKSEECERNRLHEQFEEEYEQWDE